MTGRCHVGKVRAKGDLAGNQLINSRWKVRLWCVVTLMQDVVG